MKKLLLKTLLVLLVNLLVLGVGRAQDIIDYAQVGLMKADYDHRAVLYIGNSQKAAIAILGAPSARSTYYSEMDNEDLKVLHYGNNKLYFDSHGMTSYDIIDPTIAVGKNYATSFRVGRNRGGKSPFYGIAVETTPGKSRNLNYKTIASAGLKSGSIVLDSSVEVLFDGSENVFNICLFDN